MLAVTFAGLLVLSAGQAAAPIFDGVETTWLARCFGLGAIGIVYLAKPGKTTIPARWLPVLAVMGVLDVTALGTSSAAGSLPDAAFATVVSSAFGAVTVLLARAILKEPVAPLQAAGIVLIFAAVAVLAGA